MNIFLPNNVFTRVIVSCLPAAVKDSVSFDPSVQITQKILNSRDTAGFIPAMDLINHRELFVSSKFGLSFEQSLCNSYLYYASSQKDINSITLSGDVSAQEVILSKILFKEIYNSDVKIEIITELEKAENRNFLLVGDDNFINGRFLQGISFSEEVIDTLSVPYVNYVLASTNEKLIKESHQIFNGIDLKIYDIIEQGKFDSFIETRSEEYIKSNISSLIINFDEQDIEGIKSLLQLPYYHGMIKDMVEVKFV
jgi:hypothetical protein